MSIKGLRKFFSRFPPRVRKFLRVAGIIVASVVIAIIFLISPIAKFLIERYDQKILGREITLDWAYVNPLTGYIYLRNVDVRECDRDTVFFSARGIGADFALWKLFSGEYEVTELTLHYPRGTIDQRGKHVNFDDLITRFSPDSTAPPHPPVHVNILNITLKHGEFVYRERIIPIHYLVKDLNVESTGKRWSSDTLALKFSFLSQDGKGKIEANGAINLASLDFRLSSKIRDFDLEIVRQYLWELINYGMFSAQLDADVDAKGNFRSPQALDMAGRLKFSDFHLGKTTRDDYFAFKKLELVIQELSPVHGKFLFDSVTLDRPFFKYEKFDSLNNLEMLFGRNGSNVSEIAAQPGRFNLIIELGRYLKKLTRNFFQSHYKVNRFRVRNADFRYSDYSLSEEFTVDAKSLAIRADSIDKNNRRIHLFTESGVKPYGHFNIALSINPKDSTDFDLQYDFEKVPLTLFNPYLISYTSYPLDRGTMQLNGLWNVRNGIISSKNHLLITDPRATKRRKNKDIKYLPLPLIMAFVRERANVIDYDIPITGNLKDPKFHLGDVVADIVKNIFVKPATTPYGIEYKSVEQEIENSLSLKWEVRQHTLTAKQKHFLEKAADFLHDNSEASIAVYPTQYTSREKEKILFFEAKKKYFLLDHGKKASQFTREDSLQVDKMSVKDPAFVHILKEGISDTVMFTIQEKCAHYVGQARVERMYSLLEKQRKSEFLAEFVKNGTDKRVKIHATKESVPYNGFSVFRIDYQGDIPKALRKAYEEMHELEEENPRKTKGNHVELARRGKRP